MSVEQFRPIYEKHVGYVVAGDVKSALADMEQETSPPYSWMSTLRTGQ
ncbi:hypothetical protein [Mycobacterium sp.]